MTFQSLHESARVQTLSATMPRSHLGIGAGKKIHALYKSLKRRQAAEAAGDAEAAGITIPCPACAGRHRAHTCAKGLTQPRAAPGEQAATAARLGAATAAPARPAPQFERIEDQEEIDDFFDLDHMRERQLEMLREERARADAALAAATSGPLSVTSVTAAAAERQQPTASRLSKKPEKACSAMRNAGRHSRNTRHETHTSRLPGVALLIWGPAHSSLQLRTTGAWSRCDRLIAPLDPLL